MKRVMAFLSLLVFLGCANEIGVQPADAVAENSGKDETPKTVVEIAYNRSFYVSATGSDSNSGTRDDPWKTIHYAINSVDPGDRVVVSEGEYIEEIYPEKSGEPGNYITLEGEGSVVITSADTYEYSSCIALAGVSYLYFKNLTLKGGNYTNFVAYDNDLNGGVNHIILDEIESYDSFIGVSFQGVEDSSIINSSVHDNQHNIELIDYNKNILIENNDIFNTSIVNEKFEPYWSHNLQIYSDGKRGKTNQNIDVINNRVHGARMQGILAYRTQNTLIQGNTCYENGSTGIQVESDDLRDSKNVIVQNNITYNNSRNFPSEGGIWIDDTEHAVVRNNESYGNELGLIVTGSKYVSVYNNDVHDNFHTEFINGGGLVISSSKGQMGQDGVDCSFINVFNNRFIANGANSQRAQILIGYYEYDDVLRVADIIFKNNEVGNTPEGKYYRLDLQAYGDRIRLDYNRYYHDDRAPVFFWQMERDPWGNDDYDLLASIPGEDEHSTFTKNEAPVKTSLTEVLNINSGNKLLLENSIYFTVGDSVVINDVQYKVIHLDQGAHIVELDRVSGIKTGDKVYLDGVN